MIWGSRIHPPRDQVIVTMLNLQIVQQHNAQHWAWRNETGCDIIPGKTNVALQTIISYMGGEKTNNLTSCCCNSESCFYTKKVCARKFSTMEKNQHLSKHLGLGSSCSFPGGNVFIFWSVTPPRPWQIRMGFHVVFSVNGVPGIIMIKSNGVQYIKKLTITNYPISKGTLGFVKHRPSSFCSPNITGHSGFHKTSSLHQN